MTVVNYLKCCFKRAKKILFFSLLFTLFVSAMLMLVAKDRFKSNSDMSEENALPILSQIKVGLVGDVDNKYIKFGLVALKSVDISKDYLEIVVYDSEDEASLALADGEIAGYMIIPENFISSVLHGENAPATFVIKNSLVDLTTMLVNDVVSTVSNLVVESQVGIFAMEDVYEDYGLPGRSDASKEINAKYISFVICRDDMVEVTTLGSRSEVSTLGYYACAFMILLLIFIGVMCAHICVKANMALPRLLSSRSCSSFWQTVSEFLPFFAVMLASFSLLFSLASISMQSLKSLVPEFSSFSRTDLIFMFCKLLPIVLLVSSMQFFIYSLCNEVISATLLQFTLSFGLAFVSGCIYPTNFFPEGIKTFASHLPLGIALEHSKNLLCAYCDNSLIVRALVFSCVFICLSVLYRRVKIGGDMNEKNAFCI